MQTKSGNLNMKILSFHNPINSCSMTTIFIKFFITLLQEALNICDLL